MTHNESNSEHWHNADLGWEWKLGGLCFAGGVNGGQWRGPRLSHFLNLKNNTHTHTHRQTEGKKKYLKLALSCE